MAKQRRRKKRSARRNRRAGGARRDAKAGAGGKRSVARVVGLVAALGVAIALWILWPDRADDAPEQTRAPATVQPWDLPPPRSPESAGGPAFEDFAGADACAACHPAQSRAWSASTHGRASGSPSRETVVSDFDGTVLEFSDARVRLEEDGDAFLYHVEREGRPTETLAVSAFVGGGHMIGGGTQASFSTFPDGSLRLLPFDYSATQSLWFCDLAGGAGGGGGGWTPITPELSLDRCRHWPPQSIFVSNCGNCHSSQLDARFDAESRRLEIRTVDLAINCESCHGPGRRHIELAESPGFETLEDIGMQPLALLDSDESLGVCFRCHANTQRLAPGYLPGRRFEDYYALNFYESEIHHPDGRTLPFGYQDGHLYSDCSRNGSLVCTDCHDPHSQQYRDIDGFGLPGRFDDRQCVDCHASKAEAPERHTRHARGSAGSACTACHMPFFQQRHIGTQVRYARSDHTIAIPRPQFDAEQGLEGACAQCHADRSVEALSAAVETWWGELKPHPPAVAGLAEARRGGDVGRLVDVFVRERPPHPPADFDLLRRVGAVGATGLGGLRPEALAKLKRIAAQGPIDERALALALLH
ncbi:MAG: hypothetical protein O7G30_12290, partial [Proteobacteria bacterium]|nr:hypothetical protein [Pseudomonadota bacterium]